MSDAAAASLNQQEAKETCDALCELSAGADQKETKSTKKANKYCPKQLQLPMFLSSKCSSVVLRGSVVHFVGRTQLTPFVLPQLNRNLPHDRQVRYRHRNLVRNGR